MSERELLNKLTIESYKLRHTAFSGIPFDRAVQIRTKQDELYRKSEFLKKYRKAKEKLNEESNQKDIKK